VGRARHFLQPLVGDVAGAVAQCDKRDRRISLESLHPPGRAGRRTLGGFVRVLGYIFSDRVQAIAEVPGYLVWVILGFIATDVLGWKIMHCMEG